MENLEISIATIEDYKQATEMDEWPDVCEDVEFTLTYWWGEFRYQKMKTDFVLNSNGWSAYNKITIVHENGTVLHAGQPDNHMIYTEFADNADALFADQQCETFVQNVLEILNVDIEGAITCFYFDQEQRLHVNYFD